MSSPEFKFDKACFIDPASGRVHTYGHFQSELTGDPVGEVLNLELTRQSATADQPATGQATYSSGQSYSILCRLVSNMIRGNDFRVSEGGIQPIGSKSAAAEGSVKTEVSALPLTSDWLQRIRGSASRIQLATSGTTGQPKQVFHSVETLTRGVRSTEHHENDIWGLAYPLDHLAGLQVLFQALFNRNTIVQLFGLPTEMVHQAIEKYGITHLSCTPTFLKLLATDAHSHVAVKRLTTGGERSDSTTLLAGKRLFPNARHRNIYALTEVGNLLVAYGDRFTVPPEMQEQVTVIDGSLAIHRSLLADPTTDLAVDQYIPESNSANPTGTSHDDWFLTGDLVDIVNEQPLTFKFSARRDDVINVGGHKVVPQQVEECLIRLPQVQQVVVYGQKNSVTGQIVACDVVLEPGMQLDLAVAKQQLAEVLPRYAVPRLINIIKTLRMTPTGKLCRHDETS
jgi:acyl-coenzyme A synthetase/AMP-(fatty) acid ligase